MVCVVTKDVVTNSVPTAQRTIRACSKHTAHSVLRDPVDRLYHSVFYCVSLGANVIMFMRSLHCAD